MTRCAAVDQDVNKVAVIVAVVVGDGRCRGHEGQTVEWTPFTVGVEYVCRIVLELPAGVDG